MNEIYLCEVFRKVALQCLKYRNERHVRGAVVCETVRKRNTDELIVGDEMRNMG